MASQLIGTTETGWFNPGVNPPPFDMKLLLTKRIGNATEMLDVAFRAVHAQRERWAENVPSNVWIGATVVNQDEADRDIPKLLDVPARVRFLSMEPLLGPVDLNYVRQRIQAQRSQLARAINGETWLDWVIVGSESGPGARRDPNMVSWVASLRDQCVDAGVAFLWKQDVINGKKIGAPQLEGQSWQQFPA